MLLEVCSCGCVVGACMVFEICCCGYGAEDCVLPRACCCKSGVGDRRLVLGRAPKLQEASR
jgi:hypothetical protein